jgi:hypothetical protein
MILSWIELYEFVWKVLLLENNYNLKYGILTQNLKPNDHLQRYHKHTRKRSR